MSHNQVLATSRVSECRRETVVRLKASWFEKNAHACVGGRGVLSSAARTCCASVLLVNGFRSKRKDSGRCPRCCSISAVNPDM